MLFYYKNIYKYLFFVSFDESTGGTFSKNTDPVDTNNFIPEGKEVSSGIEKIKLEILEDLERTIYVDSDGVEHANDSEPSQSWKSEFTQLIISVVEAEISESKKLEHLEDLRKELKDEYTQVDPTSTVGNPAGDIAKLKEEFTFDTLRFDWESDVPSTEEVATLQEAYTPEGASDTVVNNDDSIAVVFPTAGWNKVRQAIPLDTSKKSTAAGIVYNDADADSDTPYVYESSESGEETPEVITTVVEETPQAEEVAVPEVTEEEVTTTQQDPISEPQTVVVDEIESGDADTDSDTPYVHESSEGSEETPEATTTVAEETPQAEEVTVPEVTQETPEEVSTPNEEGTFTEQTPEVEEEGTPEVVQKVEDSTSSEVEPEQPVAQEQDPASESEVEPIQVEMHVQIAEKLGISRVALDRLAAVSGNIDSRGQASGPFHMTPATFQAIAKRQTREYDIQNPNDVLEISLIHFQDLLKRHGGDADTAIHIYFMGAPAYEKGKRLPDRYFEQASTVEEVSSTTSVETQVDVIPSISPEKKVSEEESVALEQTEEKVSSKEYTIQSGDHLWKIVRKFLPENASESQVSTKVKQVVSVNNIQDPSKIFPGQKINVPMD